MKMVFAVVFILVFNLPAEAASDWQACLKTLKKKCTDQSYNAAVVRCSWGLIDSESVKCKDTFNLLFQYSLSKMEEFKAEECRQIQGCDEYTNLDWQKQYKQNRKRILDAFRKKLIEPEKLEKLYEAL